MAVFRVDLQRLARLRLREAKVLIDARLYAGAYHIAGFSVECALKACLAKAIQRYQFPEKRTADKAFTHNLSELVSLAGLSSSLKAERNTAMFDANWSIVTKWGPEIRYEIGVSETDSRGLYTAIATRNHGVLQWIRKHW